MIYIHFNTVYFRIAGELNETTHKKEMVGMPFLLFNLFIFLNKVNWEVWDRERNTKIYIIPEIDLPIVFLSGLRPLPAVSSLQSDSS